MSCAPLTSMQSLAAELPEVPKEVVQENCPICLVSLHDKKYQTKNTYNCKKAHTFHSYCLNTLRLVQYKYTGNLSCYVCKVSLGKPKATIEKCSAMPVDNINAQDLYQKGTAQFQEYQSTQKFELMNECLINLSLAVDFDCEEAMGLLAKMELIAAQFYLKKVSEHAKELDLTSIHLLEKMLVSSSEHGNKKAETLKAESEFIIGNSYFLYSKSNADRYWISNAIEHFKKARELGYANASRFIGECELEAGKIILAGEKDRKDTFWLDIATTHFKEAMKYGIEEAKLLFAETELNIGKIKFSEAEMKSDTFWIKRALEPFECAHKNGNEEAKEFIFKVHIAIGKIHLKKGADESDSEWVELALESFEKAIQELDENAETLLSEGKLLTEEAEKLMRQLTSS